MADVFGEEHTDLLPRVEWERRRGWMVWLVGAALLFAAVIVLTFLTPPGLRRVAKPTLQALQADADELSRVIGAGTRAARDRVEEIAHQPMVRAAILTDAATVADMAKSEFTFSPRDGETFELFQVQNRMATSLARWPGDNVPIIPLAGHESRLQTEKGRLHVVVSAPVQPPEGQVYPKDMSGVLALSYPIAVSGAKVAAHATAAAIEGAGDSINLLGDKLLGDAKGDTIKAPIANTELTLSAVPRTELVRWVSPVRYACLGLGGLFVVIFIVGWRRNV